MRAHCTHFPSHQKMLPAANISKVTPLSLCAVYFNFFTFSSHSSALLSATVRWWWYGCNTLFNSAHKRTFTRTTGGTDTRHWCTVKMFRNQKKKNTQECAAVHMHWTDRSINTQPFDRSQKLLIVERSQCSTAAVSILYVVKWNRLFNYQFFRIFFLYIDSIESKQRGENDLI